MNNFSKKLKVFYQNFMPEPQNERLTFTAFKKLSERYRLSEFLTYRYADKQGIWLADNPQGMDSLLLGFELSPLIIAGDKATEKIESLLSHLPVGSVIHSIVHASYDIEAYLNQWIKARQHGKQALYEQISQRRKKYFIEWSNGKHQPIQENDYRPRIMRHYWFIRLPSSYKAITLETHKAFLHDAKQIVDRMMAEFNACQIPVIQLDGKALIKCLRQLINCHRPPSALREEPISATTPVNRQLLALATTIQLNTIGDLIFSDRLSTSERHISKHASDGDARIRRVLSITQFPDTPFFISQMAELIGSVRHSSGYLPGEFYAFTVLEILSTDKTKFHAGKKMAILHYQTASTKEFWQQIMRPLYQRKQHVQELFNAFDKRGAQPVRAWSGLVISACSERKLSEATSIAQSLAKSIGMTLSTETAITLPAWLASLPGQYRKEIDGVERGLQRGTTMKASNAATLAQVQGDWQGSAPSHGGLLVMSRRGTLANLNLFDTYKSNYNAIMAASSGAGKSFMVNEIAVDFLARGGIVRIIDAGRSYYNTAEALNGQNLVFDHQHGFCINPFSNIHTQTDLQEDMDTLVMLIAQMAFPFGFGGEPSRSDSKPYEYRCIEAAIEHVWKTKQNTMSVRDLNSYNKCITFVCG